MKIKTILLTIAGFLALTVGIIGIVVPILPTAPFIMLSLFCFSRTPKIKAFMLKSKFISDYYHSYKEHKGLKPYNAVVSILFLWITLGISIIFIKKFWIRLLLLGIGVAVTTHIIYMTKPRKKKNSDENDINCIE